MAMSIAKGINIAIAILLKRIIGIAIAITFVTSIAIAIAIVLRSIANSVSHVRLSASRKLVLL